MPRSLATVLRDLDTIDVRPDSEARDRVWSALLDQIEDDGCHGADAPPADLRRRDGRRRPWLLVVAAAVVAAVVTGVVVLVPQPDSALAVVRSARARFASPPPMTFTLRRTVSVAQLESELGRRPEADWVETTEVAYESERVWRTELVGDDDNPFGPSQVGRSVVSDGTYTGTYDPATKQFVVTDTPMRSGDPGGGLYLVDPALHEGPTLDDESIEEDCTVVGESTVAGRETEHIRCDLGITQSMEGMEPGDDADVHLDAATGLVLAIGYPNGAGFEVSEISVGSGAPASTFEVEPPSGATLFWNGAGEAPARFRPEAPAGLVSASVSPRRPTAMAAAGEHLWVATAAPEETDLSTGELLKLHPRTGAVLARVEVPPITSALDGEDRPVASIAELALDGPVLYALSPLNGHLYSFDAERGDLLGEPVKVGENGKALRLTVADDAVWISSLNDAPIEPGVAQGLLRRIDPVTGEVLQVVELPGAPFGGVTHAAGSLWLSVSESPATPAGQWVSSLVQVDLASGTVVSRIVTDTVGFVAVGETNVLVTGEAPVLVDKESNVVSPIAFPGHSMHVAVGADGTAWASLVEGHEVIRIDLASGTILDTVDVGSGPTRVVTTDGGVWVSVLGARMFVRIPT